MNIQKKQVLCGPNVWSSTCFNLIQIKIGSDDLQRLCGHSLQLVNCKDYPAFADDSLAKSPESAQDAAAFIARLALSAQRAIGHDVSFCRTRVSADAHLIAFEYRDRETGLAAADLACLMAGADEEFSIELSLQNLRAVATPELGPSTRAIVHEAASRNIPWQRDGKNSSIRFGYGSRQKRIRATISGQTSLIASDLASDKCETKRILEQAHIPVPKGTVCHSANDLKTAVDSVGFPMVMKPFNGNQGRGATIGIRNFDEAEAAFRLAQEFSQRVIVEKCISGSDYRILVIGNKFAAASKRIPAMVTGDGQKTIRELIDEVNADELRGCGHENCLTRITVDADTESMLSQSGFTPESVPPKGQTVFLKSTANLSTGGTAIDATDEVHPENIFMAERIARLVGLDICGIDIMASDLSQPIAKSGGAVLEVNAAPGFRMHLHPTIGKSRNVAASVMDMLYPENQSRIPIIAVTGTNGKTTTTRLLAHIARQRYKNVGFTTTDGIYIGDFLIQEGDTTGPMSSRFILNDPTVDFAVLETARGGMLRSGLSFDACDIGIITNIKEDHLGLNDIHTLDDLANVKAVVARAVKPDGWAVLNADDPNCIKIASELSCNVAYFSVENSIAAQELQKKHPVAICDHDVLTIIYKEERIAIAPCSKIPLTFDGSAKFMVANAMAASLAAYLQGFTLHEIRTALSGFKPGFDQTPGRLNHFTFGDFSILVDYAHNPHGYEAVEKYLQNLPQGRRIGIISGIGDRRDQDIIECARVAGRMFDHIIIRQEHDLRGRTADAIHSLLMSGISESGNSPSIDYVPDEGDAIRHAIKLAQPGDLIVALSDQYKKVIEAIEQAKLMRATMDSSPAKVHLPFFNHKINYHGKTA